MNIEGKSNLRRVTGTVDEISELRAVSDHRWSAMTTIIADLKASTAAMQAEISDMRETFRSCLCNGDRCGDNKHMCDGEAHADVGKNVAEMFGKAGAVGKEPSAVFPAPVMLPPSPPPPTAADTEVRTAAPEEVVELQKWLPVEEAAAAAAAAVAVEENPDPSEFCFSSRELADAYLDNQTIKEIRTVIDARGDIEIPKTLRRKHDIVDFVLNKMFPQE